MTEVLAAVLDEVAEVLPPRRLLAETIVVEHIIHAFFRIFERLPDGHGELGFDAEGAF